ncbi:glycosyltransferase family A protein [Microbacterium sp.]|uniref:glycosyltransferase family 2 protein n=1 Tax=Microbacterium sp. TaxID=51671 RepID=UPI0028126590|nr:glycosyltransferase family A protein [Microbacterium sp.]
MTSPTLSVVVPCYNSEVYMRRCIESLLRPDFGDVEVLIVNDGSSDGTASIADEYAERRPGRVRVVHQPNGGHGAAINTGLTHARGEFFKVVDSDDWLEQGAFARVMSELRAERAAPQPLDLLVTNFVYEKQGKRIKRSVHYRRALPRNRDLSWDTVRRFWIWQYMLMHSMIYRTEMLRDCGLHVPERSFYVDNYFAFVPLAHVRRLRYLDVDLYRYFIGRADQSVNESVMIGRIDQQIGVNLLMVRHLAGIRESEALPPKLDRYMTRYATLVTAVSSVLLVRHGTREALSKKSELWRRIDEIGPVLGHDMRRPPIGMVVCRSGRLAEAGMRIGYHLSKILVGYN